MSDRDGQPIAAQMPSEAGLQERLDASGAETRAEDPRSRSAWYVDLSGLEPVAKGQESALFLRPGKPSQLIKVRRPQQLEWLESSTALKNRLRRWRGIGPYKNLFRQNRAYLDAMLRAAELGRPPPLAHPRGLVLTDRGLGIVVQKVRDRDGGLATTLRRLARQGRIDADVIDALTRFARDMRDFHIIGNDLNPSNIVHETRRGRSRLVLIDGYGARNLIPLRRWSRHINDRSLSRRFDALAARLGLVWNARDWSFSAEPA